MVLQLSRARSDGGRFANFVMIRLVRLTIETNALSGTFARPTTYGRSCHLCLSWRCYCFCRTLCHIPRRLSTATFRLTSDILTSTQNDIYYVFTYGFPFFVFFAPADVS